LIAKAVAPKNYDEYLRPQFKGQLAVNRGVPYPLTGMVSLRGEEPASAISKNSRSKICGWWKATRIRSI